MDKAQTSPSGLTKFVDKCNEVLQTAWKISPQVAIPM